MVLDLLVRNTEIQPQQEQADMNRIIILCLTILMLITGSRQASAQGQQSSTTIQIPGTAPGNGAGSPGINPDDILNPDKLWNDPSDQYRYLDPWRISMSFGGGLIAYNDLEPQFNGVIDPNLLEDEEETAGLLNIKIELSARVTRTESHDWYLVSAFTYEGQSVDNVFDIRGGTHNNDAVGVIGLQPVVRRTKILNRNQTSAVTGVRLISRSGQLAYSGAYLTGIGSRKWYGEDLVWVNRLELDVAYRFEGALFGPFGRILVDTGLDSEEVAKLWGNLELGVRYVMDLRGVWLTAIDGFAFLEGGKWNDDTSEVQVSQSLGIVGAGGRLRVWNFLLELKIGYILSYSFSENFTTTIVTAGLSRRDLDGSGDIFFIASLQVDF